MTDEEKANDIYDICLEKKSIYCNIKMGEETCSNCKTYQMYKLGLSEGKKEGFEAGYKKATERAHERQQDLTDTYIRDGEKIRKLGEEIATLKEEKQQIQEQVKKILLDENAETGDIRKLVGMDWYDVKEIEQLKYNLKCRDDELAELRAQNKTILEDNDTLNKWVDELKAKIEKMKCCGNCKHKFESRKKGGYTMPCEATEYKPCDKWELSE